MSQVSRISRNNTTIAHTAKEYSLALHKTRIAHVDLSNGICTVDNGGWPTATTRTRLTQFFREKGINAGISTHKGQMFLHNDGEKILMDTAVAFKLSAGEMKIFLPKT